MPNHIISLPSRFTRVALTATVVLSFVGVDCLCAAPIFSVSAKDTIYTSKQRKKKGKYWPDGNFGVIANGDGTYDFYAANSSKIRRTTGTLDDPAAKKQKKPKIYNVPKKTYKYIAGGPVYEDSASGMRLMVYHAEKHYHGLYSTDFGLAFSLDPKGKKFYDLGPIITPNIPVGQSPHSIDMGGGSFVIKDGQFNVYYRDYLADGGSSQLAVARAPLDELISNSLNGVGTSFTKYYDGGWTEPGIGGKASPLEVGNPGNWWSSVSYNEYLDQMVLVTSKWQSGGTGPDLYLATSPDGLNWSERQPLVLDPGEQMYPTIVGTGANPQVTGKSFYVYYTDGNRWSSAELARREVTFDPEIPPVVSLPSVSDPVLDPTPTPTDWALVSDFQDEFQGGGPAEGWTYAWNPTGKRGNSAQFSSLLWSDSAQTYNTTGGATTVFGPKTHDDDYLRLGETGGHPGRPSFMPIVGYTIQADDGDGLYRLIDSSIQKNDGTISSNEDGLGVLVYVNDTLLGSEAIVSTNGSIASFDRYIGQLSVGDTVWVMIDPLKTQNNDAFIGLDFSLQKAVELATAGAASLSLTAEAVPEPSSAALVLLALVGFGLRSRRQTR